MPDGGRGFAIEDFAKLHPGGTLGKKLYLRVADLYPDNEKPEVRADVSIKEVIMEMTRTRLGVTAVTGTDGKLIGIITDGDLRRMLEKDLYHANVQAKNIMTINPKTIDSNALAVHALELMRNNNITELIVTENNRYFGIIHLHDLIKEGII